MCQNKNCQVRESLAIVMCEERYNMLSIQKFIFFLIMTLLSSINLLASDIYLPALPELCKVFNCTQSAIHISFSFFLLALGICELLYGVLSDYFGRKKIIVAGLSIFVIASLLCASAETLQEFVLFRIIQAIGGAVGLPITRAMIKDYYDKKTTAKIFSFIFLVVGIIAAFAPFVGGHFISYFTWKSIFYFISGLGFIILLLVLFFLKETYMSVDRSLVTKIATNSPKILIANCHKVIFNKNFLGYVLLMCAGYTVFRCFIVESPFIFNNIGYNMQDIGGFYILLSASYLVGNLLTGNLITKYNVEKLSFLGLIFLVIGGLAMMLLTNFFKQPVYATLIPMLIITLGNGFLYPTSSAIALSSVPENLTGMASGLIGFIKCMFVAFFIHWIDNFSKGETLLMSYYIAGIIFLGLMCYLILISKNKLFVTQYFKI